MADQLFLIRLLATRPEMLTDGRTLEEAKALEGHNAYLERLTRERVVLLAGRTQTADFSTFGVTILRASDEAAARRIVREDPVVAARVMRAEVYPYRISYLGRIPSEAEPG